MSYKVEAIVLKSRDSREFDRIYSIFSRERGKYKVVAKGVRKTLAKLAGGLEPVTFSEIFLIEGRVFDRVTGVIVHDQFLSVKSNIEKLKQARILLEILDQVATDREPSEEIFKNLVFYLDMLNSIDEKIDVVQLGLIWKLIKWSGYEPKIYECYSCHQWLAEQNNFLFYMPQGIICEDCLKGHPNKVGGVGARIRIDKNSVKLLRIFLDKKLELLTKIVVLEKNLSEIRRATKLMLEEILSKRIYL